MSAKIKKIVLIPRDDLVKVCTMCGKEKDCRPYGYSGAEVCFSCGETIPDVVEHNMGIILYGESGKLD